jgi:hypothetical protein
MKNFVGIVVLVLLTGCLSLGGSVNKGAVSANSPTSPEKYLGYQPISPIYAEKVTRYNGQKMEEVYWASIDKKSVEALLPLQSAELSVSKIDIDGKISYLPASLSAGAGSYTVIMDYMKYRVEDVTAEKDVSKKSLGNGRVGVGLRIKAIVETNEANLNLGGLLVIGLEAKMGRLKGGISVDVIGIDSADVTNLIPLTMEIDQTSIQAALQALASIKTKISDDKTKLTPHLLAIKQAKEGAAQEIIEGITRGLSKAKVRVEMKNKIISFIAPGNFDKVKWDSLVDKSNLSEDSKNGLKALKAIETINDRLDGDAAMNGTIISALYEKL